MDYTTNIDFDYGTSGISWKNREGKLTVPPKKSLVITQVQFHEEAHKENGLHYQRKFWL